MTLAGCGFSVPGATVIDGEDSGSVAEASPEGPTSDAPAACPASYTAVSGAPSLYRWNTTSETFWTHNAGCDADLPGATHLAVLDTRAEALALHVYSASLSPQPNLGRFYIGAVQDPSATSVSAGWIQFTGDPTPALLWAFLGAQEPCDGVDCNETNHDEQLAVLEPAADFIIDVRGSVFYGAVCECDHRAVTTMATNFITNDPNNPN